MSLIATSKPDDVAVEVVAEVGAKGDGEEGGGMRDLVRDRRAGDGVSDGEGEGEGKTDVGSVDVA